MKETDSCMLDVNTKCPGVVSCTAEVASMCEEK